MTNFTQNSIFTNYALERISKDLVGSTYTSGSLVTGVIYKVGTGVVLNETNPNDSDFSGLQYVLNEKDIDGNYTSDNITVLHSGSLYTITIQVNPNMKYIGFSQLGLFSSTGEILGFVDIGKVILMSDFLIDSIYRVVITIDTDTKTINLYKQTLTDSNLVGVGELLYKFISVKIGQGNNDLDPTKTDVSSLLYTLPVENVSISEDNIITVIATIPEDLINITITEIGLFENFQQGNQLFTYTKVDMLKPADLGYKLVVQLNLEMEVVRFSGSPDLVLNTYEYASREDLDDLAKVFLDAETNLERTIYYNGQEIGYNLAQTFYQKEKDIKDILYSVSFTSKYNQLLKYFSTNLKDLFYLIRQDFSSYYIPNLADDNSIINISDDQFISLSDHVNFNNGPFSLAFTAKVGTSYLGTEKDGIILIKADDDGNEYFTLKIETDLTATTNARKLVFRLNSNPSAIGFNFNIESSTYKSKMSVNYLHYIITFNGNLSSPVFNMYINGESQASAITTISPTETTYLTDLSTSPLSNFKRLPKAQKTEPLSTVNIVSLATFSKIITATEAYMIDLNMPDTSHIAED